MDSLSGFVPQPQTEFRQKAHVAYDDTVVVIPAPHGADPVEQLRAELAGMRDRGVPLYRLHQITRGRIVAALDLLDGVESYSQIRQTPKTPAAVVDLARDLWCARAAERDCQSEVAA